MVMMILGTVTKGSSKTFYRKGRKEGRTDGWTEGCNPLVCSASGSSCWAILIMSDPCNLYRVMQAVHFVDPRECSLCIVQMIDDWF